MAQRYQRLAAVFAFMSLLAGCGGGSNNAHPPAPSSPSPGLTATAIVAAGGTNAALAGGGTTSTAFSFPAASAGVGATLTFTASTTPPENVTGASLHRTVQSVTSSLLEYILVQSSAAATFSGTPALTFDLPSSDVVAGGVYTLELYSSTNSDAGFTTIATGTLSGSTLTFAAGTTPFTIAAAPAYVIFALKLTTTTASPSPSPSMTPTATPTPTPTPSPTPSGSASPSSSPTVAPTEAPGANNVSANATYLIFAAPTASPQSFVVTETNGSPLIESDTCTSNGTSFVSIAPSGTSRPSGETITVTVTPLAVGTCAVTYGDPAGNHVSVGINVANPTPVIIQ